MREKLIELLEQCDQKCEQIPCEQCTYDNCLYDCGNKLRTDHLIANGVTIQKWIPVSERLPESYKLVLAVCKSGKIFVGEYVDLGWKTLWRIKTARDSTKEITRIVTHWMPLPEPPKGE